MICSILILQWIAHNILEFTKDKGMLTRAAELENRKEKRKCHRRLLDQSNIRTGEKKNLEKFQRK